MSPVRLGVNIDHVATVRNARGGPHPDPVRAAKLAIAAGADGITAHLREDRRHIRDEDVARLEAELAVPLNLEMAATEEMRDIALSVRPHAVCLVPERREERTTEGGLNAAGGGEALRPVIRALGEAGMRVSLFIEPDMTQIDAAHDLGAPVVEFHTGRYCRLLAAGETAGADAELSALRRAAAYAASAEIEVHMGHGLDFETVGPVAAIPQLREVNIGHFLMGEAMFVGLEAAVARMRAAIAKARAAVSA